MFSVRPEVFETNSSSVHAACILTPEKFEEYDSLKDEVMVSYEVPQAAIDKLGIEYLKVYPFQEIVDKLKNDKSILDDLEVYFYNEDYTPEDLFYAGFWSPKGMDDSSYTIFKEPMKSPDGDDVVVLGYIGYS